MRLCPIGLRIVGRGLVQVSVASDGADNVHTSETGNRQKKVRCPKNSPPKFNLDSGQQPPFGEWGSDTSPNLIQGY